jgi:hypothetical protein
MATFSRQYTHRLGIPKVPALGELVNSLIEFRILL